MKTKQFLIHCLPNYFNAEHRIILSLSNSISLIEIKKVSFSKNKMARKFNFVNQLYNLIYVDFEFSRPSIFLSAEKSAKIQKKKKARKLKKQKINK